MILAHIPGEHESTQQALQCTVFETYVDQDSADPCRKCVLSVLSVGAAVSVDRSRHVQDSPQPASQEGIPAGLVCGDQDAGGATGALRQKGMARGRSAAGCKAKEILAMETGHVPKRGVCLSSFMCMPLRAPFLSVPRL